MAKKRKAIAISLAAKCQLLFGLAVLVIIAGALAVPWQRMEQLAGQPNVKAARFTADMLFRQVHTGAAARVNIMEPPAAATTMAATRPATLPSAMAWNTISTAKPKAMAESLPVRFSCRAWPIHCRL